MWGLEYFTHSIHLFFPLRMLLDKQSVSNRIQNQKTKYLRFSYAHAPQGLEKTAHAHAPKALGESHNGRDSHRCVKPRTRSTSVGMSQ